MFRKLILLALLLPLAACVSTVPKKMKPTFYPALPQRPRLQFLTTITSEDDLGNKQSAMSVMLNGKKASRALKRPFAFGSVKGKIYVCDTALKHIIILDLKKKKMGYIKENKKSGLVQPFGIYVSDDGFKYVADAMRKKIMVYGPDEKFVRAYGEKGQFERPMAVAVHGKRIYVVDFKRYVVVVIDKESGKTIQTIGGPGANPGRFERPTNICLDLKGDIFVNDAFNFRIQEFDPQGKYLRKFGYPGTTLGGFARPKGIDVSPDGKFLYVVDAAFENVQIFQVKTGELALYFGGFGKAPGSLYLPGGIYIDNKNIEYFKKYAAKDFKIRYLVIVGNMLGHNKLSVYGFGDWTGKLHKESKKVQGVMKELKVKLGKKASKSDAAK
jgi:sugar lactone lactonase YvrE